MSNLIIDDPRAALDWGWDRFEPIFNELNERELSAASLDQWMRDWTQATDLVGEIFSRLSVATTQDTADSEAETRFRTFLGEVYPKVRSADQRLKERLLASGLEPNEFAVPMRGMRAEAALFREPNLPLQVEERNLSNQYNKIIGAQTVEWAGEELTLRRLALKHQDPSRELRERAWRAGLERQLADRAPINTIWSQLYDLRGQLAKNAEKPDYRAYAWDLRQRFDYTPDDCLRFHEAIEAAVVPAAKRVYERRRQRLGLSELRPWDLEAKLADEQPLRPYDEIGAFTAATERILTRVDEDLGEQFAIMRREELLDLENRKGKAPGGYCTSFPISQRPFIFMNAVASNDDVRTLLHEAGHAFHVFALRDVPYADQRRPPMEFCEVASMAMELLSAPYWRAGDGGYYSEADYARARIEHLEGIITFWPYMAVVDAFQHWAYTNPEGRDPDACDAAWSQLWDRFMGGIDYSGLETEKATGWHRKQHIFRYPFYYVEYGMAQLGAVQVWQKSLTDHAAAVENYRRALALGSKATLPQLFAAAGGHFDFSIPTMQAAVDLLETTLTELS